MSLFVNYLDFLLTLNDALYFAVKYPASAFLFLKKTKKEKAGGLVSFYLYFFFIILF